MKKKLFLFIFGILLLSFFRIIDATNYPAPFVNGGSAEIPDCSNGLDSYYDNSLGKWVCPAKIISQNFESSETLPSICIEETCPGGDQTSCYCSKMSSTDINVRASNIQNSLVTFNHVVNSQIIKEHNSYKIIKNSSKFNLEDSTSNPLINFSFISLNKTVGEECNYSHECNSDLCFNNKCINLTNILNEKDEKLANLINDNIFLTGQVENLTSQLNETKMELNVFKDKFYNRFSTGITGFFARIF
jgi:hypothetical protein